MLSYVISGDNKVDLNVAMLQFEKKFKFLLLIKSGDEDKKVWGAIIKDKEAVQFIATPVPSWTAPKLKFKTLFL